MHKSRHTPRSTYRANESSQSSVIRLSRQSTHALVYYTNSVIMITECFIRCGHRYCTLRTCKYYTVSLHRANILLLYVLQMCVLKNKVLAGRARRGDNPISLEPVVQTIQFLHTLAFLFYSISFVAQINSPPITSLQLVRVRRRR